MWFFSQFASDYGYEVELAHLKRVITQYTEQLLQTIYHYAFYPIALRLDIGHGFFVVCYVFMRDMTHVKEPAAACFQCQ
uniref:hypothetical protein n=1 Tax=Pseudoprevotella muciniphila TaxID=2133944 RepID=UPI001D0029AC|nr:hypothetical protein [Pseudoprevotella muciniphila]